MKKELSFPALLECFFTQRLMAQRQVSPHTIRSYRDTFRLLLQFAAKRLHKLPSALALADLHPGLIGVPFLISRKRSGATALEAVICGSPPSGPSFATQPSKSLPSRG